ncbi:MAG: lipoate--protein ligase family protein [Acidimicrobiia bacterium]|nr:lipoate--protein ligase family protein [Acidimicrobiia bacterium]
MLRVISDRFDPPSLDTAVSSAILHRVAAGEEPATLRLWSPQRSVAFGRQDRVRPGYRDAVAAVAALGFTPVERLAGGRAAVFHEGTLAFSWAMPETRVRETIAERFAMISGLVARSLAALGLDARIGEIPGEYCPGEWSVNLGGTHKIMGVGQRLVRGAAHLGGVIVVTDADLINRPLIPAYAALDYPWSPETTGALADTLSGLTVDRVAAHLLGTISEAGHEITGGAIDDGCLRLARDLAPEHDPTR